MVFVKKSRRLLFTSFALAGLTIAFIAISNSVIDHATRNKIYTSTEQVPHNKVGLLLGTGKFLKSGSLNPYYQYRINATAELFLSGKIDYLVISGDNSRTDYNEPQMMKTDLYALRIDTTKIYLDYAGFRTFDSVIRLKEIFGQNAVTIISQPFHNQRAIYIAQKEGISAVGYNAKDVSAQFGFKVLIREKFARAKVFLDLLFDAKPKFLGDKIEIP